MLIATRRSSTKPWPRWLLRNRRAMTEAIVKLRPELNDIPAYRAGQRPEARVDITPYKVSSNENPYEPLPEVLAAVRDAAAEIHRYPDIANSELVARLAERHGVDTDQVVVGTGSVAICEDLAKISAGPGDEILYAWRAFESYPIVTRIAGATPVQIPLRANETHDLEAMIAAVNERTRLVFLCTPNNPTGTALTDTEVRSFLDAVPSDLAVVVDEAYAEFVRMPDPVDGIAIARDYPNAIVSRTFSKAYGLAGLRVGFAIAHPSVAEALRKVATPFGVSNLAQAAALAALTPQVEAAAQARVDALIGERERVVAAARAAGFTVADQQANFVWIRTLERTAEFTETFTAAALTLRPFPGEGVRISIAETEANDRTIELLGRLGAQA